MLPLLAAIALAGSARLPDPVPPRRDLEPSALGWHICAGLGSGVALGGLGMFALGTDYQRIGGAGFMLLGTPFIVLGTTGGTLRTRQVAGRTPVWPLLTGLGLAGAGIGLTVAMGEPAYLGLGAAGLIGFSVGQVVANERSLARVRALGPVRVAIGATAKRTPTLGLSVRW